MKTMFFSDMVPHLRPDLRLHWEASEGVYVLLSPEEMINLDTFSAEVTKRCDGKKTIRDIISELNAHYLETNIEFCIFDFLEKAKTKGWIYMSY